MKSEIWKALVVISIPLFLFWAVPGFTAPVDVGEVIGVIQKTEGKANVIRQGQALPLYPGFKVLKNDTLQTGADGSISVIFQDETQLALGAESALLIDEYVFAPKKGKFSIVLKMIRGTAVYLSGLISKLAPDAARFETPSASVGIRGTKFAVKVEGR